MVKAELSYNPYLLETKVSFNGIPPPRINSLVEKYDHGKLQEWIDEIPHVFHDEMNGYDFELIFTGTDLDFDELERSLARAGVISTNLVRPFHKGHLKGRLEKIQEIAQLLSWLGNHQSNRFDLSPFVNFNRQLFEGTYPFVIIGSNPPSIDSMIDNELLNIIEVSVDVVESTDELQKTDLNNTPVLIVVDKASIKALPFDLRALLNRNDVKKSQIFFLIKHDSEKTERVIRDLGVERPQIIEPSNTEQISRYLEIHPISERIYDLVATLEKQVEALNKTLKKENELSEISNKDIHEEIRLLDEILSRLKSSSESFSNKDNLDFPSELSAAKASLMYEISHWRVKRTKIDKIDEAERLAREYEEASAIHFNRFLREIERIVSSKCSEIESRAKEWYAAAQYDEGFSASPSEILFPLDRRAPDLASDLMKIKTSRYVEPKEDFLESFGKLLAGTSDRNDQELILRTVFYCEKWRDHVENVLNPIASDIINEAFIVLCEYFDCLSSLYLNHIDILIRSVSGKKERIATQLSKDEQSLQADNDWLSEFRDKLHAIERF